MIVRMQTVKNFVLVIIMMTCATYLVDAQAYRSVTGENNNVGNPTWGASHGVVKRLTDVSYADGVSTPASVERANPRAISNEIFDQPESISERGKHSDFIWVFGQFMDHDITLIENDATEPILISVPACDEHFDPTCTGQSIIPMSRAAERTGTGTSAANPREYSNSTTSFIDASNVYGSERTRAAYLRSFEGGKLKISSGGLMPLNTVDGEFNSGRDFFAPGMDMMNPTASRWFIAGDVRANENVLLASMHTLFVREHNRWTDVLAERNPLWSDETLYQEAKIRTTAVIQAITYEEWLPAMGIELPSYAGYSSSVDPSILKVFSAAAFRLGHTMLNSRIKRMMGNCDDHPNGDITLFEAFFNPTMLIRDGGIDPLLRGMAAQDMQEIDGHMVDDVRNLLFGAPGSGVGMDLAAINIQRGREMGLPDFNAVRKTFGLPAYSTFEEICLDGEVTDRLKDLYGTVDNIDPWVGMLCEEHMNNNIMFGRTITEILKYQFAAIRDGDRYFYENEVLLSDVEKAEIKSTRLGDVVRRNTSLRFMQENVFLTETDCEHTNFSLEPVMLDAVIYPNPAQNEDFVKIGVYSTVPNAEMDIRVFTQLGRTVQITRSFLDEGMNVIQVDVSELKPGNYLFNMTSGAAHNQQQFIKL